MQTYNWGRNCTGNLCGNTIGVEPG
jgi:hypothetical protein